jgi:hypothetical protein
MLSPVAAATLSHHQRCTRSMESGGFTNRILFLAIFLQYHTPGSFPHLSGIFLDQFCIISPSVGQDLSRLYVLDSEHYHSTHPPAQTPTRLHLIRPAPVPRCSRLDYRTFRVPAGPLSIIIVFIISSSSTRQSTFNMSTCACHDKPCNSSYTIQAFLIFWRHQARDPVPQVPGYPSSTFK